MKYVKQSQSSGAWMFALAAILFTQLPGAASGSLPAGPIKFSVVAGSESYAPVTFSQVPGGHSVSNATYLGWCVQYHVLIEKGPVFDGTLHDPYAPLPAHLQGEAWSKVNYILNNKQGVAQDIQNAIWVALGQNFDGPWTPEAQAMLDGANLFGGSFVPGVGQVMAVIVDPDQVVQRLVCEVLCTDAPAPSPQFTLRSIRDGNGMIGFLDGPAGEYTIERSLDFVSWHSVMTVEIVSSSVSFTDSSTAGSSKYFYRARQN